MSGEAASSEWRPMKAVGLIEALGPLLSKRDGERWRYGLHTDETHANPVGLIHGGVLTTLADHAMSLIAWSEAGRQPVVTVHMETSFLSAAKPGAFLEVEARCRRRTGGMVFMEATISTEGRDVATASAVLKIIQ